MQDRCHAEGDMGPRSALLLGNREVRNRGGRSGFPLAFVKSAPFASIERKSLNSSIPRCEHVSRTSSKWQP